MEKIGLRRKLPSQVNSEPDHANTDIAVDKRGPPEGLLISAPKLATLAALLGIRAKYNKMI